jgi:hypothetical protein
MSPVTRARLLPLAVLAACLSAAGCVTAPPAGAPTEERLRARVQRLNAYFTKGDFDGFVSMHSADHRGHFRRMGPEELKKARRDSQAFVASARPKRELLALEANGRDARATIRILVREADGREVTDIRYDYWVFEDEDWYFDHSSFF